MVAQLRDVLSAGVANDGSRLTINLRLETEPGSLVETGFEAGPLAASVLTQALLTMYVSMREKLAAAAGDNERARALAPAMAVKVASFEIDRGRVGRWPVGACADLETAERRRARARLAAGPCPRPLRIASQHQPSSTIRASPVSLIPEAHGRALHSHFQRSRSETCRHCHPTLLLYNFDIRASTRPVGGSTRRYGFSRETAQASSAGEG